MYTSTRRTYRFVSAHRWLMAILLLMMGLAMSAAAPSWAAPTTQSPNQTVPPYNFHKTLPLIVKSPKLVNLTNHPANDSSPTWSPDGRKIAFVSYRDGNSELYVMDVDGGNVTQLTNDLLPPLPPDNGNWWMDSPAWSPDGSIIAFYLLNCSPCAGHGKWWPRLYVVSVDGSNPHQIGDGAAPQWAPDGNRLLYSVQLDYTHYPPALYIMNLDGSGSIYIGDGLYPAWSPDSSMIAYTNYISPTIFVYKVAEDETIDLGPGGYNPQWSPDGSRIASIDHEQLRLINSDGSDPTTVLERQWYGVWMLVWSVDGTQLYFWGQETETAQPAYYVINQDGSGFHRLIPETLGGYTKIWSPDRTKIAIEGHDGEIYVLMVRHQ